MPRIVDPSELLDTQSPSAGPRQVDPSELVDLPVQARQVDPSELVDEAPPQKGMFGKFADFMGQSVLPKSWTEAIDQPSLNTSPNMARLKGFMRGATEAV